MHALLAPDILPTFSVSRLVVKVVVLEVTDSENLYAIRRYNCSSYYSMVVIELGQVVARVVK